MSNAHGTRIYLDHNATTPLHSRVHEEMVAALSVWGNPSSIHQEGRNARDLVETARRRVASAVGGHAEGIVFTSGGTEADWLGVHALFGGPGTRVLFDPMAHPAALCAVADLPGESCPLSVLPSGQLDPQSIGPAGLVVVSAANHETGVLQDIPLLAQVCKEQGARLFVDAVQALGKVPVTADGWGVDGLAVSAHKIYGPKGVGALWLRDETRWPLAPTGHQERGRRGGTENTAGLVGFGVACDLLHEGCGAEENARFFREALLAMPGARAFGDEPRLSQTVCVAFDGVSGDIVVQALDLEGIAISSGAACTSGTVAPSPVLLAMGVSPEDAKRAVRFSLGRGTTREELERVVLVLPTILQRARG